MIYSHSLGRAARYYGERIALSISGNRLTFRELHMRVERIAAGLNRRGLRTGERLAILLPNGPEYIELVYACSRLGVIVVPVNPRYSSREIDRVLKDASPRGLVRRSGAAPFTVKPAWELALDEEPLDALKWIVPGSLLLSRGDSGDDLHQRHHWGGEERDAHTHKRPVQRSLPKLLDAVLRKGEPICMQRQYLTGPISRRCSPPRLLALCRLQCHVSARGRSARRLRRSG